MIKKIFTRHYKLAGLVFGTIFFALIPLFVHSPYRLDVLIIMIINAGLAMTFVMLLRTGLISLGIAAFWGFGAYSSAVLVMKFDLSFWLSLPLSALITALLALILGFPLIKNAGFTFVILTTVIGMLFTVIFGNISYLGGYDGIRNIPPPDSIHIPFLPPVEFTINDKVSFFYLALILFVVIIMIANAFYSAWAGRAWTAIGLNPRLAGSIGINVFRYRLIAFVVSSAVSGLIGSFYAHYQGFIMPETFNMFKTINMQVYAILGGIGFAIMGPLVGSAIMTWFTELVRATREFGMIFVGAMLVLLIIFLPQGLLSLLKWRDVRAKWPHNLSGIRKALGLSGGDDKDY